MYPICDAAGKRSMPSLGQAENVMYMFRKARVNELTGKRIKHRKGKPVQIRAYYCGFCDGWHLTKWTQQRFKKAPQHSL